MPEIVPVECPNAPAAVGPYSQAVKIGRTIYVSGQIPLDPKTGQIAAPDIEGQTRQVLENLKAILEFVGGTLGSALKVNVYLTSLLDFDAMNEVYAQYFAYRPPARACVEVAALPKGAMVEMDCIAHVPAPELSEGGTLV